MKNEFGEECVICKDGLKDNLVYNLAALCPKHQKQLKDEWDSREGIKMTITTDLSALERDDW